MESQRSSASNLLSCSGSQVGEEIKELKLLALKECEVQADGHFDYYMSEELRDFLAEHGVYTSVHSFRAHPHPFSKTVENHILFNIFKNYLSKRNCFISIKEDKMRRVTVSRKPGKEDQTMNFVYNRLIHAKDGLRYLQAHKNLSFNCNGWEEQMINTDRIFIHDEVHYWSLREMQEFLSTLTTQDVIYSIIYPVELHQNLSSSLYPEAYNFTVQGEMFHWFPDGKTNGAYVQPINPWLLTTSKTEDSKGRGWTITKVDTIGAHHVFYCKLGGLITEDTYFYDQFSLVHPQVIGGPNCKHVWSIRKKYLGKMITYLSCLKKPDTVSAISKIRQLTNSTAHRHELEISALFTHYLQNTNYFTKMEQVKFKDLMVDAFASICPEWVQMEYFKSWFDSKAMNRLLGALELTKIQIDRFYRPMVLPQDHFSTFKRFIESSGPLNTGVEMGNIGIYNLADRESAPYDNYTIELRGYTGTRKHGISKSWWTYLRRCSHGNPQEVEITHVEFLLIYDPSKYMRHFWIRINRLRVRLGKAITTGPTDPIERMRMGLIDEETCLTILDLPEVPKKGADENRPVNIHRQLSSSSLESYEDCVPTDEAMMNTISTNLSGMCVLKCFSEHMNLQPATILALLSSSDKTLVEHLNQTGVTMLGLIKMATHLKIGALIRSGEGALDMPGDNPIKLRLTEDHAQLDSSIYPGANSLEEVLGLEELASKMEYAYSSEDMLALHHSYRQGTSGIMEHKDKMKSLLEAHKPNIYTILGFAGSGKSAYMQMVLPLLHGNHLVISPRKNLAEDWKKKVGTKKNVTVETLEVALKNKGNYDTIILDEVTLFPNGYIELLVTHKEINNLVLIGDPLQTGYYNKNDNILLANSGAILTKLRGSCTYGLFSNRLPKNQNLFKIDCQGNGGIGPYIQKVTTIDIKIPTIVMSREAKLKNPGQNYTIGETQGLTFEKVNILLDDDANLIEDEGWMVALTRAKVTINICENKGFTGLRPQASQLIKLAATGMEINRNLLENLLPKNLHAKVLYKQRRFKSEVDYEERLSADYHLRCMLELMDCVDPQELEPEEPEVQEPQMKTHLPLNVRTNEIYGSTLGAKEDREKRTRQGSSDQIFDGQNADEYSPGSMSAASYYLQHKSTDDITFWMTIKKRLRFSDRSSNMRKYIKSLPTGAQLFKIWKQTYGLEKQPLPELDRYQREFMEKRAAKSKELLEKHSYRSDIDWPIHELVVFLKNQTCTKLEKRGIPAKAGQSIACFSHVVLCKFGAQLRRTEDALRRQLEPSTMIYSQKNYDDLDKWCKDYVHTKIGTDSDYEAFDSSQDELILAFEVHVLRFFDWPEQLILDYVDLKTSMGCKLGALAVMRFSGEFGTFFFNTICNMLYTCLRYKINRYTPIAYAGDDMYAPGKLELNHRREDLIKKFRLKAKVRVSDDPLFCGWRMTPYGIVKDPSLVLDRWKIAEGKNTLHDCLVNYTLEASYGYKLGDYISDIRIDLDAQQELIRKIICIKDKLPPEVRRIFESNE
ncbi:replicase [Pineapple vitivirus A]|uniref:Replicase n=1 Tax=Pineapple vitivirus A TaxID=2967992 RepID=A0AAE9SQQ7_9VIRU|nr:replicase [Pineapple vitivirus A]